jgi:hypothetical protein
MAEVYALRQLLVNDEGTFAEFISAPGSLTWEKNLPILDATFEPMQDREPDGSAQARLAVDAPGHKGARRCRLRFRTYWMGHITAPTGALAETWQQQLLGDGLGGNNVTEVGGVTAVGATASTLTVTGGTVVAGGAIKIGVKGDGRGDGQIYPVASNIGPPANLLLGTAVAPNNPDVVHACQLAFHSEGATLTTKRFCMLHATTGAQFVAYGCQLSKLRFSSPVGGKATIEWEYEGAYWERVARTFPDALALQSHDCAPVSGGSCAVQDFGTTTRATKTITDLEIMMDLGLEPTPGVGGSGTYQWILGWTRTRAKAELRFNALWDTSWETWWDTENPSLVFKQMMLTLHSGAGRAFGVYARKLYPAGPRPTYPVDVNGQNYVPVVAGCTENSGGSTEILKSALLFVSC